MRSHGQENSLGGSTSCPSRSTNLCCCKIHSVQIGMTLIPTLCSGDALCLADPWTCTLSLIIQGEVPTKWRRDQIFLYQNYSIHSCFFIASVTFKLAWNAPLQTLLSSCIKLLQKFCYLAVRQCYSAWSQGKVWKVNLRGTWIAQHICDFVSTLSFMILAWILRWWASELPEGLQIHVSQQGNEV